MGFALLWHSVDEYAPGTTRLLITCIQHCPLQNCICKLTHCWITGFTGSMSSTQNVCTGHPFHSTTPDKEPVWTLLSGLIWWVLNVRPTTSVLLTKTTRAGRDTYAQSRIDKSRKLIGGWSHILMTVNQSLLKDRNSRAVSVHTEGRV